MVPDQPERAAPERDGRQIASPDPPRQVRGEEDLKGLIVFLASAASDYITGECVVIDGGKTALT